MGNINKSLPSNDLDYMLDALKQNILTELKVADVVKIQQVLSVEDTLDETYSPEMETYTEDLSAWIERTNVEGIKFGESSSGYFWDVSNNPNASFGLCLPNCTTYAYGRVLEAGSDAPVSAIHNANSWHNYVTNGWEAIAFSEDALSPGDIIEWSVGSAGHVAVCESISPAMVSASDYTDDSCGWPLSGHRTPGVSWGGSPYRISTMEDISRWLSMKAPNRFFRYGSLANENSRAGAEPSYILKNPGGFFNNTKKSYICKSITTGTTLSCKASKDLKLTANDLCVVIFTDVDYRNNLSKAQRGEDIDVNTSGGLHDSSYGIIVAKL